MFDNVDAVAEEAQPVEEIILDLEEAQERLMKAMEGVLVAAQYAVGSCPYGIIPEPQHVALLRDAVKRYQLVSGEIDSMSVLIRMAGHELGEPNDIQTEGL